MQFRLFRWLVQRPVLAPVLPLTDRRASVLGILCFLRGFYVKYNLKTSNNLCIIGTQKHIAPFTEWHQAIQDTELSVVQWAHVPRTAQKRNQSACGSLMLPQTNQACWEVTGWCFRSCSPFGSLAQRASMWLRDTPPCTSTIPSECVMERGSSSGEQQICWLSPALQVPVWWPFTSAFSSSCPSYHPNHLYLLSEIPGDSFMGRCWLGVEQGCCFWAVPCWKRQHSQCVANTGEDNNWGWVRPRESQHWAQHRGHSSLERMQGWTLHRLSGKPAPGLDYTQSKDFFPYVKAHG